MKRSLYVLLSALLCVHVLTFTVFAQTSGDILLSTNSVHFSQDTFLEGQTVRIYATVQNTSNKDLLGTVQFYDESTGTQIGSDQTVSAFAHKTDDVFIDWTPYSEGKHSILISIDPWNNENSGSSNNNVRKIVNVLKDTDRDGITDAKDPDDDNDGTIDEKDAFPLNPTEWIDTDGDRIGDNKDIDDDNDNHKDNEDSFPFNPLEWEDSDNDGIGNNQDKDDDNDGLEDDREKILKTDPKNPDSDGDGIQDGQDAFPLDKSEQFDYDKDLIGDNSDTDDDNDGVLDINDTNDNNKGPTIVINGNTNFAFLNREINLDASASFDEDGSINDIHWLIAKQEVQTGNKFGYLITKKEIIPLSIVAIDNKGETRKLVFNIQVLNIDFYLMGAIILIIIVLAIIIFLKYSSRAEKLSNS